MGSINRATLPQNFLDSVTGGLMLPTPEPQYLFAKMAMAARLSLAALDAGAPTVQQFVSMAAGGASLPPDLEELARAADAYPGAVMARDEFGKDAGDTIKLQRVIYEGGGYDEASRQVQPDKPTSTTGQTLKAEEVPITIHEFEGPFSVAGNQVQPYAMRDFDTKYRKNKVQLASLTTRHLRRDYIKWLDRVIRNRFRATPNITYTDDLPNVLAFTQGAGHGISLDCIAKARKALSDREWQQFPNGRYMCIIPTAFNVQMIGDVDWRELSKASQGGAAKNLLFGYITSWQDVDFFECTTLNTYANGDGAVPNDGNAVPAGAVVEEALLFGPGAVGMGTGMAPTAFWADDTDFGKVAKVLWRSIQGFQTMDSRAVQRILFQSA